jgi:hypothetical protein
MPPDGDQKQSVHHTNTSQIPKITVFQQQQEQLSTTDRAK